MILFVYLTFRNQSEGTSIYDGVYVQKDRWRACARIDGIKYHLYQSKNEIQVANAYQIICENLADIRKSLTSPECDTPPKKRKCVQSFRNNVDLNVILSGRKIIYGNLCVHLASMRV